jgi:hypothetical protein
MHTLLILSSINKESISVISVTTRKKNKWGGMMAGHCESSFQGEGKNVQAGWSD